MADTPVDGPLVCFTHHRWVKDCIDAFVAQTLTPFERSRCSDVNGPNWTPPIPVENPS